MKETTLEVLAPLLEFLRGYEVLDEVRPAAFTLRGKDFIHFHDQEDGLWADVRLARGQIRVPVSTVAEQADLMGEIADTLDSFTSCEDRGRGRSRRRGPRRWN